MKIWKLIICALCAGSALAGESVLTVEPRELRGIPGEPLQLKLTVETDHAVPIQLHIPPVSNLVLRSVEKVPIRRTEKGRYVQKRIVIWQGIEAGSMQLSGLTVVFRNADSPRITVPAVHIVVDAVEPSGPPRRPQPSPAEGGGTNTGVAEFTEIAT